MKRGSILFLKAVLLLVGAGVLAGLLWEPHLEGRNVNADLVTIYFRDPFLAYVYVGSLPFFFALVRAFKLLGYLGQGQAFSPAAARSLRHIRHCALAVVVFIAGAEAYILLGVSDDRAGAVAMGIFASFVCVVVAAAAAVLERVLQSAVVLRSEGDLTA